MFSLVFLSFSFLSLCYRFGIFSRPISQCILLFFFFNRKIKVFFTNFWNRFLKYGSITQIYETFWTCLNTFSRFSISNRYYTSRKTNFKKLFQQFLDKRFFFILKQSLTFLMLLGIWKMFRGKSLAFKTKFRINSSITRNGWFKFFLYASLATLYSS